MSQADMDLLTIHHDEICAACFESGRQTEVIEGEEVLACSFW